MPALTYQSAYDGAVADANLGHRVTVAAVKAAQDIYAEVSPAAARKALCTTVLSSPVALNATWLLVCATDPAIVAAGVTPTDPQILTAIKNAWNAVAGV